MGEKHLYTKAVDKSVDEMQVLTGKFGDSPPGLEMVIS